MAYHPPLRPPTPTGYSWMRRAGGNRGAYMHLLADDPPLDPSSNPALHVTVAACGALGGIWVHPIAENVPCDACVDAAPLPDRSPQPPEPIQSVESEALPEGVPAARDDFGPYEALGMIPDGSTPLYAISIVSVLDPDGDQADELHIRGTVTTRDALGSIEAMKFRLLLLAHGIIGDPDEE